MANSGSIIVVEDDLDDQEIIEEVLKELGFENKLIFFDRCHSAFNFLMAMNEQPFLILSDVNLPEQNGVDFKRQIDANPHLRQKSIPFVFFSTSVDKVAVDTAYKEMTVQGFFKKSNRYNELKNTLRLIMDYWTVCKHPNSA